VRINEAIAATFANDLSRKLVCLDSFVAVRRLDVPRSQRLVSMIIVSFRLLV
jgi:hypothetical protein